MWPLIAVLAVLILLVAGQGRVEAHTTLAATYPEDGAVLAAPPEELRLIFGGALSAGANLHSIEWIGPDQRRAASEELAVGGGKELSAALPPLANGNYVVEWRAVSADGHPLEGRFSFEVAAPAADEPPPMPAEEGHDMEMEPPAADEHAGHGGHEGHETEAPSTPSPSTSGTDIFVYVSRILYYAAFLSLLGWTLWSAFRSFGSDMTSYWRRVGIVLQGLHMAAFVLFVAAHWLELSAGSASASFLETIRSTGTGQSWMFTGLLSLAGFPLLLRYRAVDGVWAALMLSAATLRGHSSSFEPVLWARLADGIHLGAASLWVGGLLAMALLPRKSAEGFRSFALPFSTGALAAFAVLALTGVVSAFLYVEQWSDVLRTTWGWLLLAKAVLALAVLPIAALLRRRLRQGNAQHSGSFRQWLRADIALLLGIVTLTALLTHASPVVERVPFHWHVMGDTVHLTVEMPDVRQGGNEVDVKVWVPEGEAAPRLTLVVTTGEHGEAQAALQSADVPIADWEQFEGFERYTYTGDVNIADPEQAAVHVVVERVNGEIYEYEKTLTEP